MKPRYQTIERPGQRHRWRVAARVVSIFWHGTLALLVAATTATAFAGNAEPKFAAPLIGLFAGMAFLSESIFHGSRMRIGPLLVVCSGSLLSAYLFVVDAAGSRPLSMDVPVVLAWLLGAAAALMIAMMGALAVRWWVAWLDRRLPGGRG